MSRCADVSANAERQHLKRLVRTTRSHALTNGTPSASNYRTNRVAFLKMTLRIEGALDGHVRTIRLIGYLQAEHLPELAGLLEDQTHRAVLDLKEVNLVDVESIQFLARCSANSVALRNCSLYIQSWIAEEQKHDRPGEG